jgi:hypothetical protein
MAAESLQPPPRPPAFKSWRVPALPSMVALTANAALLWHQSAQREQASPLESGDAGEEFKSVCEFMRLYATLRFYQLALLLGTTGSIVGALSSSAVRESFARAELLKVGALIVTFGFLLLEFRASSHWHGLRKRANELAQVLRFQPFASSSRWSPLTTSGIGLYLHVLIASMWVLSLGLRL